MAQTTSPAAVIGKRKRQRSPAYPFINLETAINRAKQFYDKEQRNAAVLSVAVKHWGYEPKSSGGLQTIAALIAFGLMGDEGTGANRKVKLTLTALRILLGTQAEDRAEAIRGAALTPKIHQQLWRRWGNNPPSDANFKHTLMFEWTPPFAPGAADAFIKEYRDTLDFARPDHSAIVPLGGDDPNTMETANETDMQTPPQLRASVPPPNPAATVAAAAPGSEPVGSCIPVSETCVMTITATGEVTQKGIAQLIAYLNLIKGRFH